MNKPYWDANIKFIVQRSNKEWRECIDGLSLLKNRDSQYAKDMARYASLLYEIAELTNHELEKD